MLLKVNGLGGRIMTNIINAFKRFFEAVKVRLLELFDMIAEKFDFEMNQDAYEEDIHDVAEAIWDAGLRDYLAGKHSFTQSVKDLVDIESKRLAGKWQMDRERVRHKLWEEVRKVNEGGS